MAKWADDAFQGLLVADVVTYLTLIGWTVIKDTDRWVEVEGGHDGRGVPLQIVLPRNPRASDLTAYLENAIDLLSALGGDSPEKTLRKIRFYDWDLLDIHNTETDDRSSIALRLAAQQVRELKQLVAFSACSETAARPYFNSQLSVAHRMVERFHFGHTRPESFAFTIQERILGEATTYTQEPLTPQMGEPIVISPIERRVMERIVRGLLATREATSRRALEPLVDGYAAGFNANMCEAISGMSRGRVTTLAYNVIWSPKLKPMQDVAAPGDLRLGASSFEILDEAASALRKLDPEQVVLRGHVTGLNSKGNPLGGIETGRTVVIRWENRGGGRPVGVIVALGREDYAKAHKAHLNWTEVEVSGVINEVGGFWRLSEPHDFRAI